ncbi:MAG: ABC transporter permease [Coriobacteriia bacterium]|nr:ABC transporter permease [Coriobacteriia bacterium]
MSSLMMMVKRNIKLFYRNKAGVFFSILALLILLVLHFVVFRTMFTDNWAAIIDAIPGFDVDRSDLAWLTDSLMFATILPIGAITVSLTSLGLMVTDREKGVFGDFLTAPFDRNKLLASYLLSSIIIGATMLLLFLIFFELYFLVVYGISFTLAQFGSIILIILLSLLFGNVFVLLIVSFFKSQQSLGAVGTILGTLIGFLSGAYIMVGLFGDTVRNIFGLMPFLQLTVLSRQAFLSRVEEITPLKYEMLTGELARDFGFELWIGDSLISKPMVALMTIATTCVILVVLMFVFSRLKSAE